MAGKMGPMARREEIEGYMGILPWLLGFFLFSAVPIVSSLVLSFTDWDILRTPNFVGLENWITMFKAEDFWISLKVTFVYSALALPLGMVLGVILSLLLNVRIPGSHYYRTLFYIPAVINGVAVSLLWLWLLNPQFGLINYLLGLIGIQGPNWLFSERWALKALVLMSLWGVGGSIPIYLAGLQNIPPHLYEAAEIDGAGRWYTFWRITLPLLTPTLLFQLIMGIIGSFQVFTQSYVMTSGGPNKATLFYLLYLYNEAFKGLRMGYGAALAWFLALVILFFTLLVFKSSPLWVYYESERRR